MRKFNWNKIDINKLTPMIEKAGEGLTKAGKYAANIVKDRNFQIGALTGLPVSFSAAILISEYKKQAEEKEELYKKALAKHNAVIEELKAEVTIDQERQDRLLAYDMQIKKEMSDLQSEIQGLKDQIVELEKKAADE